MASSLPPPPPPLRHEPSELMLPATATTAADGEQAWFFLTRLRHLGPFDHRIRRTATGGGTWRIEHHNPLASELGAVHLGTKTSLSYIRKNALGLADRSGHLMHQYVLAGDAGLFPGDGLLPGGEKALCKIYRTPRGDDAPARALQKTLDRIKNAQENSAKKKQNRAAKAQAKLASREATKASKAQHRASVMAAAAAALASYLPPAPAPASPMSAFAASDTPTPAASATPSSAASATLTSAASATLTSAASATPTSSVKGKKSATATVKGKKSATATVQGKKPAAADMATVSAAVAAAVGTPMIALLSPDALSAQLKKKDLASTSSTTGKAPSPPKRRLFLQVGIEDNVVYEAQQVDDCPPLMKATPVDCSGWVILDTRSKDRVTGASPTAV